MRHLALLSAAATVAASMVQAGGSAEPVPVLSNPIAAQAWQGFYVAGALVGGTGNIDGAADVGEGLDALGIDRTLAELEGVGAAIRLGHDWQVNKAVLGVGAAYDMGTYDGSTRNARFAFEGEVSDIATLFLRAGYDMGQWMPYVLAGYSWADSHIAALGLEASPDLDGYTIGLGADYRLGASWRGFAELSYTDFGTFAGSDGRFKADLSRLALGLSYQF